MTRGHARLDRLAATAGALAAMLIVGLLGLMAVATFDLARPALETFGPSGLARVEWTPSRQVFGALSFLYGTAVTSILALMLAAPVGLGVAVFLTDLGPASMRRPVGLVVDLLAAIPSVVYGLWAALALAPALRAEIEPALERNFGVLPLFRDPGSGFGLLAAALVLAVMILPTIAAVSRDVLHAVPSELREGGLALGATRWDVVRHVVLRHARPGLFGAIVLGLGRAVGETMAVAAVVGSRPEIPSSLFAPGYTMASVIANEFPAAADSLHVSALAAVGLLLFAVTLVLNVAARLLVARTGRSAA